MSPGAGGGGGYGGETREGGGGRREGTRRGWRKEEIYMEGRDKMGRIKETE